MPNSVSFPDVGQGASAVAVSGEDSLVVDCPAGQHQQVIAALDAGGALGPIGLVIVSHRDLDHAGGIPRLLSERGASAVALNLSYALPAGTYLNPRVKAVLRGIFDWLESHPGRQREATAGTGGVIGHIAWQVLWPTQDIVNRATIGDVTINHASVVMRLTLDGTIFLLTGDMDQAACLALLEGGGLACRVLVLPHHGASLAAMGTLLDASAPEFCVVSFGRGNPYGHPKPDVLAAVADRDIRLMCTQVSRLCHSTTLGDPSCAGDIRFETSPTFAVIPTAGSHETRIGNLETPVCVRT